MMMDWEGYRKQLMATIQQIGQASPDIVRGYRAISALVYSARTLDAFAARTGPSGAGT